MTCSSLIFEKAGHHINLYAPKDGCFLYDSLIGGLDSFLGISGNGDINAGNGDMISVFKYSVMFKFDNASANFIFFFSSSLSKCCLVYLDASVSSWVSLVVG